jgi:2-methylcitrate dehydratase PrpD
MQGPPLALILAERALSVKTQSLSPEIIASAKIAMSDTIGVTLLGASSDTAEIARQAAAITEQEGTATILGTTLRANQLDAAFANAVAGHAFDYDDFTELFGGHPSVPILPGLLAVGETTSATGIELIRAYIIGVELETRLALGVHFQHYEKGWHPTSTLGVFGAAAGCAYLLNLDATQTAQAIAIAASNASGIKANFGTMTKPLHIGQCARSGVLAAQLAAKGFTANPHALEAPQGFLDVYNGPGNYSIERILDKWFDPPLVLSPGINLKQFPCCGSTHPAIFAAIRLRERQRLDPKLIRRIEILTHPRRLPHTNQPHPQTSLESKFSIQYCVARALVDGQVTLADFENAAWEQTNITRLLSITQVGEHSDMVKLESGTFGAQVNITLENQEQISERIDHGGGRGPDNPMTDTERRNKFVDCASRTLPNAQVSRLFDTLEQLERVHSISKLVELARAESNEN